MNVYLVIRFLHIVSAIAFIGGVFARQIIRSIAEKSTDIEQFAVLSQAAGRIENYMVIPGSLAVVVFGVPLALIRGIPMFGFLQGASQNWLLASNLILVAGILLVPFVYLPKGRLFDKFLAEARLRGEMTPDLQAAIQDRTVRFAHAFEMIMVSVIVVLMVFKPF